jgi:hypothetical protein
MKDTNVHPSIKRYNERKASGVPHAGTSRFSTVELREMCLKLGVDDVGFVEISHPLLADQKADILNVFPWTKVLISFIGRLNRESLRSPGRTSQCRFRNLAARTS